MIPIKTKKEALKKYKYAVKKRDEKADLYKRTEKDKQPACFEAQVRYGRMLHVCELLLSEYSRLQWARDQFDSGMGVERGGAEIVQARIDASRAIDALWARLEEI